MEKILPSLEALQEEAIDLAEHLFPKDSGATLITLSGELGAGKTSFTQGIARVLGVDENITSPTFVLEKIYDLPEGESGGFARLIHIDAYRLEGPVSLAPLNVYELLADASNLIVIEWPEKVEGQLPEADVAIALAIVPEGRTITYA